MDAWEENGMPPGHVSLSENQLRGALAATQILAEQSTDSQSFVSGALDQLTDIVASDLTTVSLCDLALNTRLVFGRKGEALSEDDRRAFDRHFREHPLVRYHAAHLDGMTQRISDRLTRDAFENSELYDDYYRRIGIRHVMALPLRIERGTVISIVFNRQTSDFTDDERALLDIVRPLLGALYRNLIVREETGAGLKCLSKVATDAGWHAITISDGARIVEASPLSRQVLARFFPEIASRDSVRLPSALTEWIIRSRHWGLERSTIDLGNHFNTTRLGLQLTVHFLADGTSPGNGTLMLHAESDTVDAHRLEAIAAKFPLTPREREVLALVAAGKANGDIAFLLSISARTVQKHLERIFEKLGVETRTAAAMSALRYIDAGGACFERLP